MSMYVCVCANIFQMLILIDFFHCRLQKVDQDWALRMEEEEKKSRETMAALEEKTGKLEQAMAQIQSTRAEVSTLQSEAEGLRNRVRALEEAVGRLQGEADQARSELREREAEERRLCLTVEQLETDLRSSKALTESLQTELSEKERREVELLGEKEQAVTQVLLFAIHLCIDNCTQY